MRTIVKHNIYLYLLQRSSQAEMSLDIRKKRSDWDQEKRVQNPEILGPRNWQEKKHIHSD